MQTATELHHEAKDRAKYYKKSQSGLLEILVRISGHEIYKQFGYRNLHGYCTEWLDLSDSEAYSLSGIAEKSHEIPKIKLMIDEGKLHLSNARRIVSVINPENQDVWLEKAATLSQHELRREIVAEFPEQEAKPRIRPISETRSRLELGISRDLENKLKQVCDLLSQKTHKSISLEQAIETLTEGYLEKNNPIRKAKRNLCPDTKKGDVKSGRYIPAQVGHEVALRDNRQCTHVYPSGKRCRQTRWIDRHHIQEVSHGGKCIPENLQTLCSYHHKYQHLRASGSYAGLATTR